MCDNLNIKDYSVQLETLSSDKLKKLLHVSTDNLQMLTKEVQDLQNYIKSLNFIINTR
jgi:hypothetical protein